jgi:5'-3' exonuclease
MVFFHPNLEADDMVALLAKYLRTTCAEKYKFNSDIFIMANDRDYLQLCEPKTHLYDITFSPINSLVLGTTLTPQDFLIKKILMGDGSDNIMPCYITKEFLSKHNITSTNRQYLKCTPDLITKMLNSASANNELYEILNACRALLASIPEPEYDDNKDVTPANNNTSPDDIPVNHIVLPTLEASPYFKDNQFLYNARVVDFQNIPARLVEDANKIYNSVFI